MFDRTSANIRELVTRTAIVAAFATAATVGTVVLDPAGSAAWAQTQGGQGSGQGNQGEGSGGGQGQGAGGPSSAEDGEGKGGQGQGGPSETKGGKPAWASEGIPEVELGRLSVVRSPDAVLDRALAEALASLTPEMIAYYNLSYDEVIAELSLNFDEVAFIDSPLQNLALLGDLLDGTSALTAKGVTTDTTLLAAMLLGAASDKTLDISADTVIAVTTILGTPITGTAAEELAQIADAIRLAILAGHG